jgi:DNA modification methylase
MEYADFLRSKEFSITKTGFDVELSEINPILFDFQKQIVQWAVKLGRAAIWADCGLGKTFQQLEWARIVNKKTLILTPLAVAQQTIREAKRLGIEVTWWRDSLDSQITIANYENLDKLPCSEYEAVVLDESSILKSFDGKTRNFILETFKNTPYKLACSATPAPNDFMEIGNHAEFLNILKADEMLSMFFVHDMETTQKWRLKGHAKDKFWRWIASWATCLRKPSDLGYDDSIYTLPALNYIEHKTESLAQEGQLFVTDALTLGERLKARKVSTADRVQVVADLVNNSTDQWLIWCNLNSEAELVKSLIPDAVEIAGSDKSEVKSQRMLDFSDGKIRVLVTKPKIAGFGINWQNCHNMAFLGLSDSYEALYQAVRRCWRFGQTNEVNVHIVISEAEGAVLTNIKRKDAEAGQLYTEMKPYLLQDSNIMSGYKNNDDIFEHERFTMHNGDCVEKIKLLPDNSVGFSIFSPPFASLYTYSSDIRDMGNCSDHEEFFTNFRFLVKELHRVMQAGRNVAIHCMNLPTSKARDGVIGLTDFRGDLIRMFREEGFIFHSEVCIWKDPVTAMQRTKALGLLYKQLKKDSAMSRQGIPDYLIVMRKAGVNTNPVVHNEQDLPCNLWQQYASPIWMDINPSDTIQYRSAREHEDEKHICPLQLGVIRRALHLWTNKDDLVLSPFAGIGSEGYCALEHGRRFVGIELKTSYYKQAVSNLLTVTEQEQLKLFA